jgi:hypothetical protein
VANDGQAGKVESFDQRRDIVGEFNQRRDIVGESVVVVSAFRLIGTTMAAAVNANAANPAPANPANW